MKVSPCSLSLLLAILSTTNNVYAFNIGTGTSFRSKINVKSSRITLSAGFTTDAYLNSISQIPTMIPPPTALSASEAYLNSLNSLVVAVNGENNFAVEDISADFSSLSLSADIVLPYDVVTSSTLSVSDSLPKNTLISQSISDVAQVVPDVTTTTSENFFMTEIPKSTIDASNEFVSLVPMSDTLNEPTMSIAATVTSDAVTTTSISDAASSSSSAGATLASPETYFMKELTVSNKDTVIGPAASDSASSLNENFMNTPPPSTVADAITDSMASSSETAKSAMEAASSTLPSTAESTTVTSTKTVEGLADALSGMSYDNIMQGNAIPPKLSESLRQTRLNMPSIDGPSFDAMKDVMTGSSFADVQNAAGAAIQTSKTQLIEKSSTTAQEVGQLSLKQLGSIIFSGIENFAKFVLTAIDDISHASGVGNNQYSTSNVFTAAYASVNELVNGASASITNTIQDIGSMTVAQAAQSFVALVILIVKLLFQILNSIIEKITNGSSSLSSISGAAMASISTQSDLLSTNVNTISAEVGNTKLSDIASMTGSFLQYSSDVMGQTYATVMELSNGNIAFDDIGIDPSYFETFITALSNLSPNF